MRRTTLIIFAVALIGIAWYASHRPALHAPPATSATELASAPSHPALPAFLPPEARRMVEGIANGGPYAHRQDGAVFGNREHLLPAMPRDYYHEYTVPTPHLHHRGARRIVTGGTPPEVWYYTDDHYRHFRRFEVPQ